MAPGPGSAVPATWVPYTSERFGYSLHHPADWTLKPSQFDWQPGVIHSDISEWPDEISDPKGGFTERGYTIYAGRQDLATGQTPDTWTAQYISKKALDAGGVCGDISAARYKPVEIDGETGQRVEMICAGSAFYPAAIVVHDGSAYLVAVATPSNTRDAQAVTIFDDGCVARLSAIRATSASTPNRRRPDQHAEALIPARQSGRPPGRAPRARGPPRRGVLGRQPRIRVAVVLERRPPAWVTCSGWNVSTMTASSSVASLPIDASTVPGCGPCGMPAGWNVNEEMSTPRRLMKLPAT